jgi:Na+-transporting methylmalonyl-CoA/oxaloacetate decarboxylase beta subunit
VILALGLVAFVFDTVGGVIVCQADLNLFSKRKRYEPDDRALAGISAFPCRHG